jgi:hypothetical protein
MFDANQQDIAPLPHVAARCIRASSCADHAAAEVLRARSLGENGRYRKNARNRKLRSIRLRLRWAATELNAAVLASEAR